MTQEEKQLLLKDLCARLPYGVIVRYKNMEESEGDIDLGYGNLGYLFNVGKGWWVEVKPYLRPMLSMTEEEMREYEAFFNYDGVEYPEEYIDWLITHHFDYRGLIPIGLALEAPEGMYK